jgi:hypothetical protein
MGREVAKNAEPGKGWTIGLALGECLNTELGLEKR